MSQTSLSMLQGLIARWKAKSPKFFSVISTITGILTFVVGVPTLITDLGIADLVPDHFNIVIAKVVGAASLAMFIISKLTVATPEATTKVLEEVSQGVDPKTASSGK